MLRPRLAIEMSIIIGGSMWQGQLYAPDYIDIFLLYLGLGPCLYIKTQYLKWSILLSNMM